MASDSGHASETDFTNGETSSTPSSSSSGGNNASSSNNGNSSNNGAKKIKGTLRRTGTAKNTINSRVASLRRAYRRMSKYLRYSGSHDEDDDSAGKL